MYCFAGPPSPEEDTPTGTQQLAGSAKLPSAWMMAWRVARGERRIDEQLLLIESKLIRCKQARYYSDPMTAWRRKIPRNDATSCCVSYPST